MAFLVELVGTYLYENVLMTDAFAPLTLYAYAADCVLLEHAVSLVNNEITSLCFVPINMAHQHICKSRPNDRNQFENTSFILQNIF